VGGRALRAYSIVAFGSPVNALSRVNCWDSNPAAYPGGLPPDPQFRVYPGEDTVMNGDKEILLL
jgi:hypothetical protein